MSERLLQNPDDPKDVACRLVDGLRAAYPGVVEEWERQRTDAIASGEDGWPDLQTASGALWWLESEIAVAEGYVRDDETGTEQGIIDHCKSAMEQLRATLKDQLSAPEPEPEIVTWVEYIGANLVAAAMNLERTGEDFYRVAIEAHMHQLKDVIRGLVADKPHCYILLQSLEEPPLSPLDEHGSWRSGTWEDKLDEEHSF